jgi:hypothetical protein
VTDARLLARHLAWAATTPAAADTAFNVVNGDVFRWRWLWPRLAAYFAVEAAPYPSHPTPLARARGLAEPDLGRLTSAWHTDADLGRPTEVMADMARSRRLGFAGYQPTPDSFADLFDRLRRERLVP